MVLSVALMQINLMQHNDDPATELLNPFKYILKTIVFALLIVIAVKNRKEPYITKRAWQSMIALMAIDLVISGVWM
jgi:glucan phosphoethanolaminetransferase (alkaline phosphatase superfamily)